MAGAPMGAALGQIGMLFGRGTVAGLTDAQLLARFLDDRDAPAFEALVARHGPTVLAVCRALLDDPHDAEDAFQATFFVLARKAAAIRGRDALGGWLHRVARRVAIRANADARTRRARERTAVALGDATDPRVDVDEDNDDRAAVREEVARLPERYRLPVVLCYLEGRTHAEAAAALRRGEATVRRRLAEARSLLRSRLRRRGVAPTVGLPGLSTLRQTAESVPAPWADATARAALEVASGGAIATGAASARAIALARRALWTVTLPGLTATTMTLVTLGFLFWTATARERCDGAREGGDRAASNPPAVAIGNGADPAAAQVAGARGGEPGEVVRYAGRVLDPQGRPAAGATLYLAYHSNRTTLPTPGARATTDPDGRFGFDVARSELDATASRDPARAAQIVAVAAGYAPAWIDIRNVDRPGGMPGLRLATDDVPIRGRVLDLEGRPVAGATIRIQSVWDQAGGIFRGRPPGLPVALISDAQGRFRLEGIGRERTVVLDVEGPTIQHRSLQVRTRDAPTEVGPRPTVRRGEPRTLYGATFDVAIPPGRTLAGVVRDRDTGRPLAGVEVRDSSSNSITTTDAQGRYELPGSPKAKEYSVYVRPAERGHPYLNSRFTFEDTPGLGPLRADIGLQRGIPLRIRVVDGATGGPVPGAVIYYVPLSPNPHVRREFTSGLLNPVYPQGDGTSLGAAWPGPGAICVRAAEDMRSLSGRYRPAHIDPRPFFGAADGATRYGDEDYLLVAFPDSENPQRLTQGQFHAVALINPDAGTESITRDIALEPGRTLEVDFLDPEGVPLTGVRIQQRQVVGERWEPPLEAASFELTGLDPARPRVVVFKHEPRQLIGFLAARGDEHGPATVRLRPWGTAVGRLVDADGKPRAGIRLRAEGKSWAKPAEGHLPPPATTDAEGRFLLAELIEEMEYKVREWGLIDSAFDYIVGDVAGGLTVRAGERKDLGDVRTKPAR